MADVKTEYFSETTLTVTAAATLANGSSGNSSAIDNTTNRYLDYLIVVSVTTASGATATGWVELWGKGSLDNTNFDDDANDRLLGTIAMGAAGIQTRRRVVSLASAFGGPLPPYVMIRVKNSSGAALTAASASYRGIQAETV